MIISVCEKDICSRVYAPYSIIYDLRNRQIIKLENVATDIWRFISEKRSVSLNELVHHISIEYDCSEKDIYSDIRSFIDDLFLCGVIQLDFKYFQQTNDFTQEKKEIQNIETLIIQELASLNQLYSATLELTYRCNEKCVHCYATCEEPTKQDEELDITSYIRIIDELFTINCLHIVFTGGEPFLYKNFFELFAYCRSKGFVCDIFTNGQYISDNTNCLERIVDLKPRAFYISIYGATAKTHDRITTVQGSFEKTIKTIKLLKSFDIVVVLNVMVLKLRTLKFPA